MKPTRPTSAISIADRQFAWVLQQAREVLPGRVPLFSIMSTDAALEAFAANDAIALRAAMQNLHSAGIGWTRFRELPMPWPTTGERVPHPQLIWCVGRETPRGEIDWCAGGSIHNRQSFHLFRGGGFRSMSSLREPMDPVTRSMFNRKIAAGTFLWRVSDFPLDMQKGVIEVSDTPQPFTARWVTNRMPLWCTICDRWTHGYYDPSSCAHVWWCKRRSHYATCEPKNILLNPKGRMVAPCTDPACANCQRMVAVTKHLKLVPDDYVPNRSDRKVFA